MAKTINTSSTVTDLRAKSETLHATPLVATPDVELKATVVEPTLNVEAEAASYSDIMSKLFGDVKLPSMTRALISAVVGIVCAGATAYGGIVLTGMLVTYALTVTTSSFLIFMAGFVGYAITMIAATMFGSKVQSLVLGGGLESAMTSVRGRVSNLFGKSAVQVAAS